MPPPYAIHSDCPQMWATRENGKRPTRPTVAGIGLHPGDSVVPSRCGRDANNFRGLPTRVNGKQTGRTACRDLAERARFDPCARLSVLWCQPVIAGRFVLPSV